jgi:hypothetical protein
MHCLLKWRSSYSWLPNKDPVSYSACQIGPSVYLLVSVMIGCDGGTPKCVSQICAGHQTRPRVLSWAPTP